MSRAEGKKWAEATADKMLAGLDQQLRRRAVALRTALATQEVGGEPDVATAGEEPDGEPAVTTG